jgi:hypothetical protein
LSFHVFYIYFTLFFEKKKKIPTKVQFIGLISI